MHKSIALILLLSIVSCNDNQEYVTLSQDKCWGSLRPGLQVQGNAKMYYFPGERTFLSNDDCSEKSIPLSLSPSDEEKVRSFYKAHFDKHTRAIGMMVSIDILGYSLKNAGGSRITIRSSEIEIHDNPKPIPINSDGSL